MTPCAQRSERRIKHMSEELSSEQKVWAEDIERLTYALQFEKNPETAKRYWVMIAQKRDLLEKSYRRGRKPVSEKKPRREYTREEILRFQRTFGLTADGILGPQTLAGIDSFYGPANLTVNRATGHAPGCYCTKCRPLNSPEEEIRRKKAAEERRYQAEQARNNLRFLTETEGDFSITRPEKFVLSARSSKACSATCIFKYRGVKTRIECASDEVGHTTHHTTFKGNTVSWEGNSYAFTIRQAYDSAPPALSPGGYIPIAPGDTVNGVPVSLGSIMVNGRTYTKEELELQERNRMASMKFQIAPHRWFGWSVLVDMADGGHWHFWRLTEEQGRKAGRDKLEQQVERAKRLWATRNPKAYTALDLWIVEPTQAEQHAKETKEWDTVFHKTAEKTEEKEAAS